MVQLSDRHLSLLDYQRPNQNLVPCYVTRRALVALSLKETTEGAGLLLPDERFPREL